MSAHAVITGISPMMACAKGGKGLESFALAQLWEPAPPAWFDPKVDIGGRGYKYVDAATCYLLAAVKQLGDAPDGGAPSRKGVIIGSNSATRRELDEMYRTVFQSGAEAIPPMRAPLFCPNMGVGTVSMKHQAKALNLTLMNPITAGLEAVALAARAIGDGRAASVIAGGMEDDSRFTLGQYTGRKQPVHTSGGAWVLRLESDEAPDAGGRARARIGATLNRFIPYAPQPPDVVAKLVDELARQLVPLVAGGETPRVDVAALTDAHSRFAVDVLRQALARHGIEPSRLNVPEQDTTHGTLLALATLSWQCLHAPRAVCAAVSPLGQLVAVEVRSLSGKGN